MGGGLVGRGRWGGWLEGGWLTAHMPSGLPSASRGWRFLLKCFPPVVVSGNDDQCCFEFCNYSPPLVGLPNFPPRPLPPGAMIATCSDGDTRRASALTVVRCVVWPDTANRDKVGNED